MIFAAGNVVLHITVGSLRTGFAHSVSLERVCNTTSVIQQPSCHMFQSQHSMEAVQTIADLPTGIATKHMLQCKLIHFLTFQYMSHCGYCGKSVVHVVHTVRDWFNSGLVCLLRVFEPVFRVITLKRTLT